MGTGEMLQPQADIRTPTLRVHKVPDSCPQAHATCMLRVPICDALSQAHEPAYSHSVLRDHRYACEL